MKSIVIYFSRDGENYVNGEIKTLKIGNTKVVSEKLQKLMGADTFEIKQKKPYPNNYNECIKVAREDLKRNNRPELLETIDNLDDYDVIYLGYPNYWGVMPMVMWTFLESLDFTGKIIKPFCTHEGSGLGRSMKKIEECCTNAKVLEGLAIYGAEVNSSDELLETWINKF